MLGFWSGSCQVSFLNFWAPPDFFFFFVDDLFHIIHVFFFLEIFSGLLVFSPSFHGFVRVFCFLFCFGWNVSWVFDIDRKFEGVWLDRYLVISSGYACFYVSVFWSDTYILAFGAELGILVVSCLYFSVNIGHELFLWICVMYKISRFKLWLIQSKG